jgi:outer membrane cobalamin receptor
VDAVPGPDNRLADQTRITANLGFDHRMTAPPLAFGGTFGYRSGGPIRTSLTQSAYSSPRRTLDLYALYRFNARVQLRMTANNLLAQDFERIDTYFDGTRTLRLSALNPGYRRVGAVVEVKL